MRDLFNMLEKIEIIEKESIEKIENCNDEKEVENLRIKYLGKKGEVTSLLKSLSSLPKEDKPKVGKRVNILKNKLQSIINEKKEKLKNLTLEKEASKDIIDISLPGRKPDFGKVHPISAIIKQMLNIFKSLGFTYIDAPELETEYYNFDALNIPPTHPARDDQDSFYTDKKILLRTQTSPAQIRTMEKHKPPIAVVHPGRCYRRDTLDATHCHTFYQIEGLLVDKNVSLANLKATVKTFAQELLGKDTKIRLRANYFPFTEPSAELDVTCFKCKGVGCSTCKYTGWIELGGLGLVDPQVFKYVGIDPEIYTGWAFGLGIERFAMTKYGIPDIRMFYENDIRFLHQF
jgi:phenylalanyl-tRNA synthetase alpha chain